MNRFDDITDMLLQGLFLQLNIFSDEKDMFSSEKVFSFGKDIGYLSLGIETRGSHCPIRQSSQSSEPVFIVRQRQIPPLSDLCAVVVKYSSFTYTF